MSKSEQDFPYQVLGEILRKIRQKRQASLAEVSGAVEIEVDSLSAIETGSARPNEDILLLLLNYFGLQDDEATRLWEMAGYDKNHMHPHFRDEDPQDAGPNGQTFMVMPFDVRVVYTDMAQVTMNDYGVVMNFMQTAGPNGQPLAVSRVGMSREHAQSLLELLQKSLTISQPKQLPPTTGNKPVV